MTPAVADIKRHLATVIAADAVGFTQRMREDARAAVAGLYECRAIITEVVEAFHGTTVGTPGDFFLALLPSGLEAVEAALEIQRRLALRNLSVDEIMRIQYRIGIGIGDIYEHGSDVLGDAVNVASRLQALAAPGGILTSASVRDAVGQQPSLSFKDLGHQALRNITEKVHVYAISERAPTGDETGSRGLGQAGPDIISAWDNQAEGSTPYAAVTDRLPIKPVVEIESFRTIGGGPEDQMFAEGLCDEVLAMLASLSNSMVVRRISDHQAPPAATNLVRRYRLGGSVRRGPSGARIIANLTETGSGDTLWADRFDYQIDQSFDAHELIARQVVTALQVNLTEGEQAQFWGGGTTSVRAWELFHRGHDLERRFTRHGHLEARRCYTEALQHDNAFLSAIVSLGFCHLDEIRLGWTEDEAGSFATAQSLHQQAIGLQGNQAECHALLAYIELHQRHDTAAVAAMEKAVRLAPRSSELAAYLGNIYDTCGRYEEAIIAYRRSMWLSQHFPPWIASNLGLTLCVTGRAEEARRLLSGLIVHHPDYSRARLSLAIALARLQQLDEARAAARDLLQLDPLFTVADWARDRPYADPAVMEALIADMRRVGLA